jgi:gas vesicle protein
VREALEGTRQSSEAFTGEMKEHIETAVTDTKLKYAELLGLTGETVKQAVKQVIDTGKDIEETVAQITRDATEKAFAEAHFSADRVRKVSHAVISAAVETAEEAGTNISEVARGAVHGTREGITSAVESTKETLSAAGAKTKSFVTEDLAQTKEDLEAVEDLFLETIRGVAGKSGKEGREILNGIADHAMETTSTLKEKVGEAAETVSNRLKELGKDTFGKAAHLTGETVHTAADEARQLSKRALDIAKGAASGILQGAKHALRKDKEDKS